MSVKVISRRSAAGSPQPEEKVKRAASGLALPVRVAWLPELEELFAARQREISAPAAAYLRELVSALGLPLRPTMRFEPAAPAPAAPAAPLRVSVGPNRLPALLLGVPSSAPSTEGEGGGRVTSPAALVDYICRTIYHNRAQLVTAEAARALLDKLGADAGVFDLPGFHALLRRMAARGFSARRLLKAVPDFRAARILPPGSQYTLDDLADLYDLAVTGDAPALSIELAPDLEPERAALEPQALAGADLFFSTGVAHPRCQVRVNRSLPDGHYRVRVNDLPLPAAPALPAGTVAVESSAYSLAAQGDEARFNPLTGAELYWIDSALPLSFGDDFAPRYDRPAAIILHLRAAVEGAAAGFLTRDLLDYDLVRLYETAPVLVEAVRAAYGPAFVAEVLRELLAEGVSIYRLANLLEALVAVEGPEPELAGDRLLLAPPAARLYPLPLESPGLLPRLAGCAAVLRRAVRRNITNTVAPGGALTACSLDAAGCDWLAGLPAEPAAEDIDRLAAAVSAAFGPAFAYPTPPVLVVPPRVRRRAAAMLRAALPRLAVLEPEELSPSTTMSTIEISLDL